MFDGKTVHTLHFTTIDSTNTWAKKHAHEFDLHALTCITSDQQTAGRGQRDKTWFSPPLGNLYMTFFFVLPLDFHWTSNLGQIFALSCAQVLKDLGFVPALKWPNDILLEEKKAGGVLSETLPLDDGIGIVLGMGLNVNIAPEQLSHLDQPATSLAEQSGKSFALSSLVHALLQKFLLNLEKLRKSGFSYFVKDYNLLLAFKGEEVVLSNPEGTVNAICKKVDEEGRLVLACADGRELHVASGTLRKR